MYCVFIRHITNHRNFGDFSKDFRDFTRFVADFQTFVYNPRFAQLNSMISFDYIQTHDDKIIVSLQFLINMKNFNNCRKTFNDYNIKNFIL